MMSGIRFGELHFYVIGVCVSATILPGLVIGAPADSRAGGEDGVLARHRGGEVVLGDVVAEEEFWYGPMTPPLPDIEYFHRPPYPWTASATEYIRIIATRPNFVEAAGRSGTSGSPEFVSITRQAEGELLVRYYRLADIDSVPTPATEDYYRSHLADFSTPRQFLYRNIFIQCDMREPEEKRGAYERAREAFEALKSGEDIDSVERRLSTRLPEDMGRTYLAQAESRTNPTVWKTFHELDPGEISGILEVRHGFMIVKLLEDRPGGPIPFENVERFCRGQISRERIRKEIDAERSARDITFNANVLQKSDRSPSDVIAKGRGFKLTLADAPMLLVSEPPADADRRKKMEAYVAQVVFNHLLLEKARLAGIPADPGFRQEIEAYRDRVLSAMELNRQVAQELAGSEPTEEDLRGEYESNPDFQAPFRKTQIRVINIPAEFQRDAPPDSVHFAWEAARLQCLELRNRALQGEDFGELARRYSVGYNASDGGLFPFQDGLRGRVIDTTVEGLRTGEISLPVKNSRGYCLIMVEAEMPPAPRAFEKVKEEVRREFLLRKAKGIQDRLLDEVCLDLGMQMN